MPLSCSYSHCIKSIQQPFYRNNGYNWPRALLVLMVSLTHSNDIPSKGKYVAFLLHREEQRQASATGFGKVCKWMTK